MKIVLTPTNWNTEKDPAFYDDLRSTFPNVTFTPATTVEEQKELIRDADAFYGSISRDVFLVAEKLRWIHVPGAGVDHIDIPELMESDVILTNVRGPHAPPMADHVMGMMVSLTHHLGQQRDDQRAHVWDPGRYTGRIVELSGGTVGILALGDIGLAIAQRTQGFDMTVHGAVRDPNRTLGKHGGATPPNVDQLWPTSKLDEMLKLCDWFIVTAPLTNDTKGMIDKRRLQLMKKGSYIIVISRGGIVDENALVQLLVSGHFAGAALDSLAEEPPPKHSKIWDVENLILSQHSSALTPDMYDKRRVIYKENLRRFLIGEPLFDVCNKNEGF